jgi:thymidylate synthase
MNTLDKQYQDLLQDILDNGVDKSDRTGTGTRSVFGRQIRHNMNDGFPLLTTKKMAIKSVMTELKWFLKGDTNIKYLVENGCNIWNGDAYKAYKTKYGYDDIDAPLSMGEFITKIKTDKEFAEENGELGPIYGKQWTDWSGIDQILNLVNSLKKNPDSRRLMVSAWNVGEMNQMVLPPCHYGFQVYTRLLDLDERISVYNKGKIDKSSDYYHEHMDDFGIPRRVISLMWNQRSVDTFLGLPFNIASYGMLLSLIAHEVGMLPGEVIGNLGDTHLYLNHLEQAEEQIGRDLTLEERFKLAGNEYPPGGLPNQGIYFMDEKGIPRRTREPFPLPTLKLSNVDILNGEFDYEILHYHSHPAIKAPLSN